MTSNYMIINYLNCLQKAATPLTVSSGRQRQAAVKFDVTPKREEVYQELRNWCCKCTFPQLTLAIDISIMPYSDVGCQYTAVFENMRLMIYNL